MTTVSLSLLFSTTVQATETKALTPIEILMEFHNEGVISDETTTESETINPEAEVTPEIVATEEVSTSITPTTIYGVVTADILNLRSTRITSSPNNILTKLTAGEQVIILKSEGDWCYISTAAKLEGYVFKQYLQTLDTTAATTAGTTSDIRLNMVAYAKQFLGNPYQYGGNSLTNGTDCSGFTQQMYKHIGISINRTSSSQRNNGTAITVAQLLPGDLIFYGYSGYISHVAMYIGEGKIIHASTSARGIVIDSVYVKGKPLIACSRILK